MNGAYSSATRSPGSRSATDQGEQGGEGRLGDGVERSPVLIILCARQVGAPDELQQRAGECVPRISAPRSLDRFARVPFRRRHRQTCENCRRAGRPPVRARGRRAPPVARGTGVPRGSWAVGAEELAGSVIGLAEARLLPVPPIGILWPASRKLIFYRCCGRDRRARLTGAAEKRSMSKQDAIELEGTVTELLPNATFRVTVPSGHEVLDDASRKYASQPHSRARRRSRHRRSVTVRPHSRSHHLPAQELAVATRDALSAQDI